ncbi:MAG TPA: heme biosynthesis protein HemY, partial [Caulobacteraceae bacterium]|nr:heme biosynthesis protein HemY [Caulobacteraceae bacterium]
MIRLGLGLLLIAAVIVTAIAVQGQPGAAHLDWLGWRVSTTAAAAVLIIGLMTLAATVFWRAVVWLLESPVRAERA